MKTKFAPFAVLAAVLAAGALTWTGCDQTYSADLEIPITPASVQLTNDFGWVVTFRANEFVSTNEAVDAVTNLFYPLEWSVSNPGLGIILSSTGDSAIYQSFPGVVGANVVICRDQSGREGQAAVALTNPVEEEDVVAGE